MKGRNLSRRFHAGRGDPGCSQGAVARGLVWMAIRDINAVYDDDAEPMNRPPVTMRPPEGMIRAVDVSHDGRPDWLVDYEPAGVNAYCGTGGCLGDLLCKHRRRGLCAGYERPRC